MNSSGLDESSGAGMSQVPVNVELNTSGAQSKLSKLIALVGQLESKLASIGNASGLSQLSAQMASMSQSAQQLQQSLSSGLSSKSKMHSSLQAGMLKAQREVESARQNLERLNKPLGAGHSRSQIHAHHEAMLRAKTQLRRASIESQDYAQLSGTGEDKWLRQAAEAKARLKAQLAQGVTKDIAEHTYDSRVAEIRADRQAAHDKALSHQAAKADNQEQAGYRSGEVSVSDYQAYLKSRLSDPQTDSHEDNVLSSRLDKLIEVGERANEEIRTHLGDTTLSGADRGKAAILSQAQAMLRKGADPKLVTEWENEALAKINTATDEKSNRQSDNLERNDYQSGKTNGADYLSYLKSRLAATQSGSSEWEHLTGEIQNLNKSIESLQVHTASQDYLSGKIDAQAYKERLAQVMNESPSGSRAYDSARRGLETADGKSGSGAQWGLRIGDTVSEAITHRLEESLERPFSRRRHQGGILSIAGGAVTDGAIAGGGSMLRNLMAEFSKGAVSSVTHLFEHGNRGGALPNVSVNGIQHAASQVFQSLHGGILQLAVDAQALASISGAEGKKRQKHSLVGGLLGGVLGSFSGNWFGGAQIGSSLGGMFASGGNPPVGIPSLVGEKGPELFVPRSSGTVLPNNMLRGLGSGSSTNMHVTVNHYGDVNNQGDVNSFHESIADGILRHLAVSTPMTGALALG